MHTYKIIEQGQALNKASKAMIALHGRGGTSFDILKVSSLLCDDTFYKVAPQATHNSWYPYSFMAEEKENEPWLSSAIEIIKRLIDSISFYIPKNQIYIMGFSQGACLSLEVSSRYAEKYGGVIAFTGGLIGKTLDEKKYSGNFEGTKVFIGTSDQDPYIPLLRSEQSKELMKKFGADVLLKIYKGMAHTINKEELDYVKENIII